MIKRPRPTSDHAEAANGKQLWSVINRLGRVLLSVVIVLAVIYCLRIVQDIRSADQRRTEAAATPPAVGNAEDAITGLLTGNWQFVGVPWQVSALEMSSADAIARVQHGTPNDRHNRQTFEAYIDNASPTGNGESVDSIPETASTDELIYSFLQLLQPPVSESAEHVIYHFDRPGVQAVALAPKQTPKQIEVVHVALQLAPERWNYIQLQRQESESHNDSVEGATLLPVPSGRSKLANRRDPRGRIVAELVAWDEGMASLKAIWSQAGWLVSSQLEERGLQIDDRDKTPAERDSIALAANVAEDVLICKRGDESRMVVVSTMPGDSTRYTLLIMRSPE